MKLSHALELKNRGFRMMYSIDGYEISKVHPIYSIRTPYSDKEFFSFMNLLGAKKRILISGTRQSGKSYMLDSIIKHEFSPGFMEKPLKVFYSVFSNAISRKRQLLHRMKLPETSATSCNVRFFDDSLIRFTTHNPLECRGQSGYDYVIVDDATENFMQEENIVNFMLMLNEFSHSAGKSNIVIACDNITASAAKKLITDYKFQEVRLYGSQVGKP